MAGDRGAGGCSFDKGRPICCGRAAWRGFYPAANLVAAKALSVRGSHVGNSPQLRRLIEMYKKGKLKPIPVEVRPPQL